MSIVSRRLRRAVGEEAGFTLIEILVAALILTIGIAATVRLVASSEAASVDSELIQLANEEAEQALEEVRSLPYAQIGHASAPTTSPPGESVISETSFTGPGTDGPEELAAPENGPDGGGSVVAVRPFTVERGTGQPTASGTIYTYVTWRSENCSTVGLGTVADLIDGSPLQGSIDTAKARLDLINTRTNNLLTTLSQLAGGVLTGLTGSSALETEVEALRAEAAALKDQITDVEGVIDTIPADLDLCSLTDAELESLQDLLGTDVSSVLAPLTGGTFDTLVSRLSSTTTQLGGLIGNLTCSLPFPLGFICGPAQSQIDALLAMLQATGSTSVDGVLDGASATLDEITGLDLSGLTTGSAPTHNQKRITVGVVIDQPTNTSPENTVWLSTIATDPEAGLLFDVNLVP